jgi:putative ABC transport system substrate-binding protein
MKRRAFITLIGGAAAAWPLAARAQQHPPMGVPLSGTRHPVIGVLSDVLTAEYGFRRGLSEMEYVEGHNVAIDYRSSGQLDRLPAMAADLVSRKVAVIVSIDSDKATRVAMAATTAIPIVFTTTGDPVQLGFVPTLNRPGGNATGITTFGQELLPKRLELLRELLPKAIKVALLFNPNSPATSKIEIDRAQFAARQLGLEMFALGASTVNELERALSDVAQQRAAAILVASDLFLSSRREYIAVLALRYGLATISNDHRCCCRPTHELRLQFRRNVSIGWSICRPHSQGRKARGPSSVAADQV